MQAKTVTAGPVTAAVTNQAAASQTPYAGQIVLNGAGATFSINNVAASQDPASAGNLTLAATAGSFDQREGSRSASRPTQRSSRARRTAPS